MEFKISDKLIKRKKCGPFYAVFFTIFILVIMTISHLSKNSDMTVMYFVYVAALIPIVITTKSVMKDLKRIALLSLNVTEKGIIVDDGSEKHLLSYERIQSIKVKSKKEKIQELIIKTNSGEIRNYSEFEKLDEISSELKKYLNKDLWEKN